MRTLLLAAFGNTIYIYGIAACLSEVPGLKVVLINPDAPEARQSLDELAPDVIAFELGAESLELPIALLLNRPGLLLVALDRESDEILVLSGERAEATTATELVDVLLRTTAQPA